MVQFLLDLFDEGIVSLRGDFAAGWFREFGEGFLADGFGFSWLGDEREYLLHETGEDVSVLVLWASLGFLFLLDGFSSLAHKRRLLLGF